MIPYELDEDDKIWLLKKENDTIIHNAAVLKYQEECREYDKNFRKRKPPKFEWIGFMTYYCIVFPPIIPLCIIALPGYVAYTIYRCATDTSVSGKN